MYPLNHNSVLQAYKKTQMSAMSTKQMEVMAFRRATSMLKQASENVRDYESYTAALKFNQRLWTAIQAGLTGDNHRVPEPVRTKLLNLSLFVDNQTLTALTQPKAEHLSALIDINISITDGLAEQGRAAPIQL